MPVLESPNFESENTTINLMTDYFNPRAAFSPAYASKGKRRATGGPADEAASEGLRGDPGRPFRPGWIWVGLLALALLLASPGSAPAGAIERMDPGELMTRVARARGKLVLLHFWATWCSACKREMDVLADIRQDYPRNRLILLGISMDDTEGLLSRFLNRHKPGYPVYLAGRGVASSFEVTGVPKTIIYDGQGRKVYSTHGFVPAEELRQVVDRFLSGQETRRE